MKKITKTIAAAVLAAAMMLPVLPIPAAAATTNEDGEIMIRVGLASSSRHNALGQLACAHLENADGYGEANAILKVQQATADAIKLINEAAPGEGVIKIKALEAFAKAADGKATKIIIPSELQSLAGMAASAKSVFDSEEPKA